MRKGFISIAEVLYVMIFLIAFGAFARPITAALSISFRQGGILLKLVIVMIPFVIVLTGIGYIYAAREVEIINKNEHRRMLRRERRR